MHKGPKLPAGWPRSGSINFDGGELSWRWHASASNCRAEPPAMSASAHATDLPTCLHCKSSQSLPTCPPALASRSGDEVRPAPAPRAARRVLQDQVRREGEGSCSADWCMRQ